MIEVSFVARETLYYNKMIKIKAHNLIMGILFFLFHQKRKQNIKFSPCYQIITEWLYVPISNGENVTIHISNKIKKN